MRSAIRPLFWFYQEVMISRNTTLKSFVVMICCVQLSRFSSVFATLGPFHTWRRGPFTSSEHKPASPNFHSSVWASNKARSPRTRRQQQPPQGKLISAHVEVIYDGVFLSDFLIFCVVCNTRGEWGETLGNKNHRADVLRSDNGQQDTFQSNQYVSYGVFSHPEWSDPLIPVLLSEHEKPM